MFSNKETLEKNISAYLTTCNPSNVDNNAVGVEEILRKDEVVEGIIKGAIGAGICLFSFYLRTEVFDFGENPTGSSVMLELGMLSSFVYSGYNQARAVAINFMGEKVRDEAKEYARSYFVRGVSGGSK